MENVITQENTSITKESFKKSTSLWKNADVLQLTHHFHKLDPSVGQYERVYYFSMSDDDVKRFNAIQEIDTFTMHMALKRGYKEKFTFFPIFEIVDEKGNEQFFGLEAFQKPEMNESQNKENEPGSEIVPQTFKQMIHDNWEQVDMSLVDDLFTVKTKKKPMERVLFYKVTAGLINPYLPNGIEAIKFYPGLDMNKFQYKDMISFTPVIGITPKNPVENISQRAGIIEYSDSEVFIEYSSPCPPTCAKR
ncbi:hypothetical protein ATE84_0577 [Aquimarina sp. MAR_2010_214]|uniref:hypothetical protein n=1 Tax=Aquimarina sp. MAR_2010_214 TaxID=1250026 RepID=UPI000C70980D|nr:hypothetical protein [Aquimarina sp. MAR_2010_214]PKV48577.1 hypothetical protein ATE84_0577 [Aquimarina sp. MAR_2010_214]